MANWIKTKINYDKIQENGTTVKRTSEAYLIDADTFAEAENRIRVERQPYISGDFEVKAVSKTKIQEIFFNDDADLHFWQVKWNIISIDEKPASFGKEPVEKKITILTLVQADTLDEALKEFHLGMRGSLGDYEILAIVESDILDVYENPEAVSN